MKYLWNIRKIELLLLCGLLFILPGCTNIATTPQSQKNVEETNSIKTTIEFEEISSTKTILEFEEEIDFTKLIQQSITEYSPEYETYIEVLQDPNNLNECYFTISVRFPEEDNPTGLLV